MNERYLPIGRVARWAMILLAAVAVLDVIAALSDFAEIRLLDRIIDGELVSDDEADASDTRQAVIGGIQFLVYAATAFVFIRWFRRCYRNLAPLGAERTRFKSWWTIAGWFIPIWNAFRPKQLLNDIWRGSDPRLPPAERERRAERYLASALVHLRAARDTGLFQQPWFRSGLHTDPDLAALRGRPDFEKFLAELEEAPPSP